MRPSLVRVRLLSFGPLRHAFAVGGEWYELPEGATVSLLLDRLESGRTLSSGVLRSAAVAVNQEYASAEQTLAEGDEVAILPPVSGGAGSDADLDMDVDMARGTAPRMPIALVREAIDVAKVQGALKTGADGAVCTFDGVVRNNTRGRATLHLDYEAYEDMALKQMAGLRTEAIARFGVREVAIVHRLGRLTVGETSIYIAVASAHRDAAFLACRWVIDTLKKTVPIWKKEQFTDGAVWADGEPFPEGLGTPR